MFRITVFFGILFLVYFIFSLTKNRDPLTFPLITGNQYHFWGGELMDEEDVCTHWGHAPLDERLFKSSNEILKNRSQMACALLKNQNKYIGLDSTKIREIFGNYNGHYFSDIIPTYFIERRSEGADESWQIVFLLDKQDKVAQIVVHKNCCDD